jgi:hypothetical protein
MPLTWSIWMDRGRPLHSLKPHQSQRFTIIPARSKWRLMVIRDFELARASSAVQKLDGSGRYPASLNRFGPGRIGERKTCPALPIAHAGVVVGLDRRPVVSLVSVGIGLGRGVGGDVAIFDRFPPRTVRNSELLVALHKSIASVDVRLHRGPVKRLAGPISPFAHRTYVRILMLPRCCRDANFALRGKMGSRAAEEWMSPAVFP